jgi:hypothetical protein
MIMERKGGGRLAGKTTVLDYLKTFMTLPLPEVRRKGVAI